jgi:hypothetical protein
MPTPTDPIARAGRTKAVKLAIAISLSIVFAGACAGSYAYLATHSVFA